MLEAVGNYFLCVCLCVYLCCGECMYCASSFTACRSGADDALTSSITTVYFLWGERGRRHSGPCVYSHCIRVCPCTR